MKYKSIAISGNAATGYQWTIILKDGREFSGRSDTFEAIFDQIYAKIGEQADDEG